MTISYTRRGARSGVGNIARQSSRRGGRGALPQRSSPSAVSPAASVKSVTPTAPSGFGGPGGIVMVDKKNDHDDKAFEKGVIAKAAGFGFPPEAIARAKKKL